jgi:hypothetical protein
MIYQAETGLYFVGDIERLGGDAANRTRKTTKSMVRLVGLQGVRVAPFWL